MYLLLGYTRASLPSGFPVIQACRHWPTPLGSLGYNAVIPVSAGTDAAKLLGQSALLHQDRGCQTSGFNTEHLQKVPLRQTFSSSYKCIPYSFHTLPPFNHSSQLLLLDCLWVPPESILCSSVLVPKSRQTVYTSLVLFSLLPLFPSQAESVPSPTRCCNQSIMYF